MASHARLAGRLGPSSLLPGAAQSSVPRVQPLRKEAPGHIALNGHVLAVCPPVPSVTAKMVEVFCQVLKASAVAASGLPTLAQGSTCNAVGVEGLHDRTWGAAYLKASCHVCLD